MTVPGQKFVDPGVKTTFVVNSFYKN